ncbi:MAG: 2-polyprenylphenol 6-hydroxylase [Mariprofundaceae bacterium]|nr:2-polyprenylphenol 6-hydroxylase [Mariprofundaceae bacterium]
MKIAGNIQRNLRLLKIGYILTTHGMAALAMRMRLFYPYAWLIQLFRDDPPAADMGVQIRLALEKLGPTFIKFGQMLSTRVDLLPLAVAMELKRLQDNVPPAPFEHVKKVIQHSFKKPMVGENGLFHSFEETPIAAASIAQVHFATLHNGQQVAVKIRRPDITRMIEADLAILRLLARMFERYFPEYHRLKACCVIEEFSGTIRGELNLRSEAAHASHFEENFANLEGIRVPAVQWAYTSTEVLTTERISGIPIDEKNALIAANHDVMKLCTQASTLFFHMAFIDGYFHADMHPGNIFVANNGDLVLVDFGIVGRLDMRSRRYLGDMLLAFLQEDYYRAAMVHVEAGYVPASTNVSAFEDALREIAIPIFNRPLEQISIAELLFGMFAVTERFHMETRPELLLLQKTMVVLEGVARELAGDFNMWASAKPLIAAWAARNMGPVGKTEAFAKEFKGQMQQWMVLPERLNGLIQIIEDRHATVQYTEQSKLPRFMGALLLVIGGGLFVGVMGDLWLYAWLPWAALSALLVGLLLILHE